MRSRGTNFISNKLTAFSLFTSPILSPKVAMSPTTSNGHPTYHVSSSPIGLGIVDALISNNKNPSDENPSKPESKRVLFGSELKVGSHSAPPIEFGVKTKASGSGPMTSRPGPGFVTGCLSPREMELSEDYTRVIAHGPNPRTTHIFDNFVVWGCTDHVPASTKDGLLSFCYACKKDLQQGEDIFIYRGEEAFCSSECRQEAMILNDEGMENCSQGLY